MLYAVGSTIGGSRRSAAFAVGCMWGAGDDCGSWIRDRFVGGRFADGIGSGVGSGVWRT